MTAGESNDPYYDLIDDFDLIVASFQSQYGIRLSKDLRGMKWGEFKAFLSGLDHKTPLGRMVSIRSESDKEILKHFTKEQHTIRNEWNKRKATEISDSDMEVVLNNIKKAFLGMS